MLYDEALRQLDKSLDLIGSTENAASRLAPTKIENLGKTIIKTQEVITELMVSLDFDKGGEIAKNLFALYTWFNQELFESNISHDAKRITKVRAMIADLRSAWVDIAARTSTEGMANPQGFSISG
jgi:flagellar protein FliS